MIVGFVLHVQLETLLLFLYALIKRNVASNVLCFMKLMMIVLTGATEMLIQELDDRFP